MRLTIRVLPLTADNAPGAFQAEALAAFQQRVFALPVDAEDSFEHVWRKIEERYQSNYLEPQYAAYFAIKKLQDGRSCDLDLSDTVGSIFNEEAVQDRIVQVIPSLANRLFSLPPGTNLRPSSRKRHRELSNGGTNKRLRPDSPTAQVLHPDSTADGPIPSVESDHDGPDVRRSHNQSSQNRRRTERSNTGASVMLLGTTRHEQPEFTTHIKSESPELGVPPSEAEHVESPARPPGQLSKPVHSSYDLLVRTPDRARPRVNVSTVSLPIQKHKLRRRMPLPMVPMPHCSNSVSFSRLTDHQQGHLNQEGSESRTQSTPTSGSTRNAYRLKTRILTRANDTPAVVHSSDASVPYTNLKKSQLVQLLHDRGMKIQQNGQRDKAHIVQRLLEHDDQISKSPYASSQNSVIQETPQIKKRDKLKKQVLPKSINIGAHSPNMLSGINRHTSESGDISAQHKSKSSLPIPNDLDVGTQAPKAYNSAAEISSPGNKAGQLSGIATESARLLSRHAGNKGSGIDIVESDQDNLAEASDLSSARRPSYTVGNAHEDNDSVSIERLQSQSIEAANEVKATDLERKDSTDVHSPAMGQRRPLSRFPNRSPLPEVGPDTFLNQRANVKDAISCPSSPELGAGYYLNGTSSVWHRNDSITSKEASKAGEQVVEELLGTGEAVEADAPQNASESDDETKSSSSSANNSARSSPVALREPAQWLAKSPSPHRLESDAESGVSKTSSRFGSPIGSPDGDNALGKNSSRSNSDSESDAVGEVNRVAPQRSSSPASPEAPPSAQSLRCSTVPGTRSSTMQVSASQPSPQSARPNNGINTWFSSASQPPTRSPQSISRLPSASQPVLPNRASRPTTVYTSLKAMLNYTRGRTNNVVPVQPKPSQVTTGDARSLSQKKLPTALDDDDSEDDKSYGSSSSSSSDGAL